MTKPNQTKKLWWMPTILSTSEVGAGGFKLKGIFSHISSLSRHLSYMKPCLKKCVREVDSVSKMFTV